MAANESQEWAGGANEKGTRCMESGSRYGRASLAAGEEGAFQSWLGYTIRGDSWREEEEVAWGVFVGKKENQ